MSDESVRTGSAIVAELQKSLNAVSASIKEISDLMSTDMRQVGEAWQDGKYQEYVDAFTPQIQKCEEIAEDCEKWSATVLGRVFESAEDYEHTKIASAGGAVSGAGAAAVAGSATTGAVAGTAGKPSRFNNGTEQTSNTESPSKKKIVSRPTAKTKDSSIVSKIDSHLNNSSKKKTPSKFDKACIQDTGGEYNHGEIGTPSDHNIERTISSSDTINDELNGGVEYDVKILKGKLGADTGVSSTVSQSDKIFIKCSKE